MKKYFFYLGFGVSIVYAVNSLAVDFIEYCPEDSEDKSLCIYEAMDEVAEFPKVEVITNPSFSADLAVKAPVHEIKTEPGEQVVIELDTNPYYTGNQKAKIQKAPKYGTVSQEDNTLYYESKSNVNMDKKEDSFSYALIDPNGKKSPISKIKLLIAKPDLTDSENIYNEIYATQVDPGLPTFFDIGANYDPKTQKLDLDPSFKSQIVDNGDGTLTYLPQPGFEGLDRFSYTVTHANGKKFTFLVKLEVGQVEEEEPKPVEKPKKEEPKPVEKPKKEEPKPVEKPKEEEPKPVEKPKKEEPKPVEKPKKEEPKPVEKPKKEEPKPVEKPKEEEPKPVVKPEPSDQKNSSDTNTVVVDYTVSPSVYVDHYTTVHAEILLIIDISVNVTVRQPKVTINPSANSWVRYSKNGSLIYLSNPGFRGVDMFSYTVSDRQGKNSSTFTVKVAVDKKRPPKSIPLTTRKAYAVQDNDGSDSQFFTIDPGNGSTIELGSSHKGLDIEGMAIRPLKNELYATSGQGQHNILDGYLYQVDAETGDLTPVGDTDFSELAALTFRSDGTLWAGTGNGAKKSNLKKGRNQGGIIKINPQTAKSNLMFSFPWESKTKKVEGLAWSMDGSVLYASENNNLWELNCQDWKKICSNFPGEVEALETLADGMLLFAVSNHNSHVASVYDPETCTIVLDRPFKTAKYYSDVEAIVWPLESQFSSEIEDWDMTFTKKPRREKQVCLETTQKFKITGEVKITPPESLGYIETYWHVTNTENAEEDLWSFTTQLGSATSQETDCNVIFPQQAQTITGGTTTFHLNGHWQGLPKKAKKNVSIETHYGVNLYDREHQPLSIGEFEKTLVLKGTKKACSKAKSKTTK